MEIWQAVVLGIVEGVTEYLPISSTGHLILAAQFMGLNKTAELKHAVDAFAIVIQGGAILAVLGLYWPRVLQMIRGLLGKDPAGLRLVVSLVCAFIPAAILGKLLDKHIEAALFYTGPVVAAMILGGAYMLLVDEWRRGRFGLTPGPGGAEMDVTDVTPRQAVAIGLMQCIAMWPGTSRSMMTITGGMFMGLRPKQAAEFSFLLGLPTLTAATLYKLYKNYAEAKAAGTQNFIEILGGTTCAIGIAVAAISAALAVKWLVGFLNKHGLGLFGWYRIGLGILIFALWLAGVVSIAPKG
ncbi:MAG: undecaprenyl-diphosphate phosphatase [Planctomycetota bacterium]|nr:undecaprenyl-diphosphate phosphatase [Planctomycetota bacterium]